MENKRKTAVEWLINEIDMQYPNINVKNKEWMIDKAKGMEKQQIIDACIEFGMHNDNTNRERAEQYYEETYE